MSTETKNGVPEKFYRGDKHPKARTVGQLIKILEELPKSLPVHAGFSRRVSVTVYNIGQSDRHARIDEPEEDL